MSSYFTRSATRNNAILRQVVDNPHALLTPKAPPRKPTASRVRTMEIPGVEPHRAVRCLFPRLPQVAAADVPEDLSMDFDAPLPLRVSEAYPRPDLPRSEVVDLTGDDSFEFAEHSVIYLSDDDDDEFVEWLPSRPAQSVC